MTKRIGEVLVERGVVGPEELATALEWASTSGTRVGSQLVSLGLADEGRVVEALSHHLGVPGVDLSRSVLDLSALALVPREVAEADGVLPLSVEGSRLLVALADPAAARTLDEIALVSGLTVLPHVALHGRLFEVLASAWEAKARGRPHWKGEAAPAAARPHLELRRPALGDGGDDGAEAIEIELGLDDEAGGPAGEEELATVSARSGPPVILAVDDEEAILTMVARTLTAKGYRVERARNGEEAWRRAVELVPDLVLLDANLPKMHGFDLARRLKADKRLARVPIVMMTAVYRGWRFASDAREQFGIDDYLEKPFRLDDLLARVRQQLESARGEPPADRARVEALLAEGSRLLEAGRAPDAVAVLESAAQADPFDARVVFQLGRAQHACGQKYQAVAALERAAELKSDHFAALRALAALYQSMGFRRKAVEAWERALPAAPDEATREKVRANLLKLL